jgi:hypothetical protein
VTVVLMTIIDKYYHFSMLCMNVNVKWNEIITTF